MTQTRDRLKIVVGQPRKVHLTRGYPGEPTHNGFILGLGRDLVLMHQFHDFYPEGYTALRVADIKGVRSGDHERFWEMMLRGEGIMDRVGISYEVPLDDFRTSEAIKWSGYTAHAARRRSIRDPVRAMLQSLDREPSQPMMVRVTQARRPEIFSVTGLGTPEIHQGRPFTSRTTDGEPPPQRLS